MKAAPASFASLEIATGDFAGTTYALASRRTRIGRNPKTDITLLDPGVSREHAVLVRDDAGQTHQLEDLGSTNGTRVNGEAVDTATLAHGDEIEVGQTRFRYSKS